MWLRQGFIVVVQLKGQLPTSSREWSEVWKQRMGQLPATPSTGGSSGGSGSGGMGSADGGARELFPSQRKRGPTPGNPAQMGPGMSLFRADGACNGIEPFLPVTSCVDSLSHYNSTQLFVLGS
jgi:hypothetical protein